MLGESSNLSWITIIPKSARRSNSRVNDDTGGGLEPRAAVAVLAVNVFSSQASICSPNETQAPCTYVFNNFSIHTGIETQHGKKKEFAGDIATMARVQTRLQKIKRKIGFYCSLNACIQASFQILCQIRAFFLRLTLRKLHTQVQ